MSEIHNLITAKVVQTCKLIPNLPRNCGLVTEDNAVPKPTSHSLQDE
jgi:hypothetical protein